uniref:SprT-like domain-containing protein n=1 Tax=Lutzomyia longipalpis TaxID=7200 RepID=A0A1B0CBA1_LUTLO
MAEEKDWHMCQTQNMVLSQWELLDPTPNIYELCREFDKRFFENMLALRSVQVRWSHKLRAEVAGQCSYHGHFRRYKTATITLSVPLLKYRPRKDLIRTLLHEMIHAYCYIKGIWTGDGHQGGFITMMNHINERAGTTISVYHEYHAEFFYTRRHVWRCSGPCRDMGPYYGYVGRHRARPIPRNHSQGGHSVCRGRYIKIKGSGVSRKYFCAPPLQDLMNDTLDEDLLNVANSVESMWGDQSIIDDFLGPDTLMEDAFKDRDSSKNTLLLEEVEKPPADTTTTSTADALDKAIIEEFLGQDTLMNSYQ